MADFAPAFDYMESHEDALRSGVVTRDEDQRTRFGICEKFHPNLPEEFWTGPAIHAFEMARQVYRAAYWLNLRLGEVVDQAVASKPFDMCVPMGTEKAARLIQRVCRGVLLGSCLDPNKPKPGLLGTPSRLAPTVDGKVGNQTIAAINTCVLFCSFRANSARVGCGQEK